MSQLLLLERTAAEWLRNNTHLLPTDEKNATIQILPREMLNTTRIPSDPVSMTENATNEGDIPISNSEDGNSMKTIPLPRIKKKTRPSTDNGRPGQEHMAQSEDPKRGVQDEEKPQQDIGIPKGTENQVAQKPGETVQDSIPSLRDNEMNTEGAQEAARTTEPNENRGELNNNKPKDVPSQQQLLSSAALIQGLLQGLRQFLWNREAAVVPPQSPEEKSAHPENSAALQLTGGGQSSKTEQDRGLVENGGPPEQGKSQALHELELLKSARKRRNQKGAAVVARRCAGKASIPDADVVELDACPFDDEAYDFLNKAQRMNQSSPVTPTERSFRGRSRQQQDSHTDNPPCVLWRQGCLLCGCFSGEVICSSYCVLGAFAYGAKPVLVVGDSTHEEDSAAESAPGPGGSSCCLMDKREAKSLPALFASTPAILRSNPYGLWDDGTKPRKRGDQSTGSEEKDSDQNSHDYGEDGSEAPSDTSTTTSRQEEDTGTSGGTRDTDSEKHKRTRRGESEAVEDHDDKGSRDGRRHNSTEPIAAEGGHKSSHVPFSREGKQHADDNLEGDGSEQSAVPSLIEDALRNSLSPIGEVTRIAIEAATRVAMEAAAKAAVESAIRMVSGGSTHPPTEAVHKDGTDDGKHQGTDESRQTYGSQHAQGGQEASSTPESPTSSQGASMAPPISAAMLSSYQEQLVGVAGNAALRDAMAAVIAREIVQSSGVAIPAGSGQSQAGTAGGFFMPPSAQQVASFTSGQPPVPLIGTGSPAGRETAPQSGSSNVGDVYGGPPAMCPSDCEIYFDGCTSCRCTDEGAICRYRWCAKIVSAPTCLKSKDIRSAVTTQ
ncbi:conserved hypothetical protein [Neospora caninum Liverpool]|uniref:Uncharacterized protein n=1 Tax=Neospora caninum (strain Liverpool) TaxID=572307 RepID=F0V767_NEOCL|nr:conserved hypothetical protein [Neospora caninum Liverpool]CBZ49558.1 conserved hypothetical protein [Neospora caninum Liverpool]CEL64137.1 TPA: hypothetical protein BN1204_000560 [Neospora caninum Liverpool]|eukprot:XP_003879593.1 conserved hypothetical protein [Neospora caninum Liverpool]